MANRKPYYIGDDRIPSAFQTDILTRSFSDKEMKQLWEKYKEARLKLHSAGKPSETQFAVAKFMKKKKDMKGAMDEFSLNYHQVKNAIKRVAVWEYLGLGDE